MKNSDIQQRAEDAFQNLHDEMSDIVEDIAIILENGTAVESSKDFPAAFSLTLETISSFIVTLRKIGAIDYD